MRVCLLTLPRASWYAGHSFPPSCLDSRQLLAQGGECEQGPLDLAYSLVHLGLESLILSQVKCGRRGVVRVSMAVGHEAGLGQSWFSCSSSSISPGTPALSLNSRYPSSGVRVPASYLPATSLASQHTPHRNMHIASRCRCMGSVVGPMSWGC